MERDQAIKPPEDLKKIVAELGKIGIDGLQLAAQAVFQTVANNEFDVQCSPVLDIPCQLTISGRFVQNPGDEKSLRLQVAARSEETNRVLCNLSTAIVAPLGRTVVLGSAPTGKTTSVFVVQVTAE
jgi:hypothetical protein